LQLSGTMGGIHTHIQLQILGIQFTDTCKVTVKNLASGAYLAKIQQFQFNP